MIPKFVAFFLALVLVALVMFSYNACSGSGVEPPRISLLAAISQGDTGNVRLHMEAGTNPNKSFVPNGMAFEGASALHLATLIDDPEIVLILIDGGANINIKAKDSFKSPPLLWAAYWGKVNSARILIQEGADIKATDTLGTDVYRVLKTDNLFIPESEIPDLNQARVAIYNLLQ